MRGRRPINHLRQSKKGFLAQIMFESTRTRVTLLLAGLLAPVTIVTGAQGAPPSSPPTAAAPAVAIVPFPNSLTEADAVRIGLARNPQSAAGQAGVAAAAANYRSIAAFPSLNLGATHYAGSSPAPTLNGLTSDTVLDLGDTFDTSGQRRFQAAGARAQYNATEYQLEETRLTLTQQIRDAYWSLAAARAQTQIAQENLQDVQRVNQLTAVQLQAGSSPRVDVVRSGIDVVNAQQASISARGAEQVALSALNTLLARPPLAPVQLADSLAETSVTPALFINLPALPDLTRTAIANRPVVKAAQEQVAAADYTLKQTRAARYPDTSLDYQRSVQNSLQTVIVGLSVPIVDFGANRNAIQSADQAKKQAEFLLQQAQQQVAQQSAQAYTDYTQAEQLTAAYPAQILNPSETLLNMSEVGYKQGATGILPVIDAENTLRNARVGYINSLLALYRARNEILAATGGLPSATAAAQK